MSDGPSIHTRRNPTAVKPVAHISPVGKHQPIFRPSYFRQTSWEGSPWPTYKFYSVNNRYFFQISQEIFFAAWGGNLASLIECGWITVVGFTHQRWYLSFGPCCDIVRWKRSMDFIRGNSFKTWYFNMVKAKGISAGNTIWQQLEKAKNYRGGFPFTGTIFLR